MGFGNFVRNNFNLPRRSRSLELKWTSSDEMTEGEGNTSSGSADEKLVKIFDIEEEVEIKEPTAGIEDVEDILSFDNESMKGEIDEGSNRSTQIVDRTPSTVEKQGTDVSEPEEAVEAIEPLASQQAPLASQQETLSPSKSLYTKEEKQKRFMKELFSLSNNHITSSSRDDVRDDCSIVSSHVGSVSSLPEPTAMNIFFRMTDCTSTCNTHVFYKETCHSLFNRAKTSNGNTNDIRPAVETKISDKEDDDSLEQALAAISQPFSEKNPGEALGVVNVPITSPITVTTAQEDVASLEPEVIDSDECSAVSVK